MKVLSASRRSRAEASLAMVSSEQSTLNQASHTSFSWLKIVPLKRNNIIVWPQQDVLSTVWTQERELLEAAAGLGYTHVVHLTEGFLIGVESAVCDVCLMCWNCSKFSPSIHSSLALKASGWEIEEVQCGIVLTWNTRHGGDDLTWCRAVQREYQTNLDKDINIRPSPIHWTRSITLDPVQYFTW